jgi:hypothetical protein
MCGKCIIVLVVIICAFYYMSTLRKEFGPYVVPTEMGGAVYGPSYNDNSARSVCLQKCMNEVYNTVDMTSTYGDERINLCKEMC